VAKVATGKDVGAKVKSTTGGVGFRVGVGVGELKSKSELR